MNWTDLQLLLAFADEGTLKGAAESEGVNMSTVSRRLRALETELGAKVVENVAGRLVLTDSGRQAVEAARTMRSASDELIRSVAGRDDALSGVVRIGLLELFVRFHAADFARFGEQHPAVGLELLTSGRLQSLTQREVDVVVRIVQKPDETLVGRCAYRMNFGVFASKELAAGGDFRTLPWIGWNAEARATGTEAWMREHLPKGAVRMRAASAVSMIDMVQAGIGAGILPSRHAKAAGLVPLSDPIEGFDTPVWVLTHRDLAPNARIRAVTDHLYEVLRAFGTD